MDRPRVDRVHELIERVRGTREDSRRLLVGTSYGGGAVPHEKVVRVSDFLLLHGHGVKDPARITEMVRQTRAVPGYHSMPFDFNEDDHEDFDLPDNNFAAATAAHASWGWFDYRRKGEGTEEGYQPPPVLKGPVQDVTCLAYSPGGRTLASMGNFGAGWLWNLETATDQPVD